MTIDRTHGFDPPIGPPIGPGETALEEGSNASTVSETSKHRKPPVSEKTSSRILGE
jgi:hypothetical protein